ncbi:MAG: tRNA lysidine(34) synthetase TilS, partial [Lachnospiraceae bacterium]|nr:tRNA lysidine(34) synthetase TilS [Lachnospiraceae bacterium]
MKQELSQKVVSFIETRNMVSRGDKVVAGISGGADSICLLFLLCEIRKKTGIEIRVVHVDHGIRKEASEDAEYVRSCCERWNVPFKLVHEDVPLMASKWGMSEEEAGRRVRYEAFEKEADEWAGISGGNIKIAIAHNMNDNAETILFRLFRGTGLKGLTGIPYTRKTGGGYEIIRPLLGIQRSEIEEFLEDKGIRWVSDA